MIACDRGNAETVKLLLAAGANLTPVDKDGKTALVRARASGQSGIAALLENYR